MTPAQLAGKDEGSCSATILLSILLGAETILGFSQMYFKARGKHYDHIANSKEKSESQPCHTKPRALD